MRCLAVLQVTIVDKTGCVVASGGKVVIVDTDACCITAARALERSPTLKVAIT